MCVCLCWCACGCGWVGGWLFWCVFLCDRGLEEACKSGKYLAQLVPAVSILCACMRVRVRALKLECTRVSPWKRQGAKLVSVLPQLCLPITLASDDSVKASAGTSKQTAVRSGVGGTVRTTHLPYHYGGPQWHLPGPPYSTCWLKQTLVVL